MVFCNKTGVTTYTDEFYTPDIWKTVEKLWSSLPVKVHANGIFEDSERRVISFFKEDLWMYPMVLLKIDVKSNFDKILHKDFLGAIMSLGIIREKIGDLIIYEGSGYLVVYDKLENFIITNLTNIKNSPCEVKKVDIYSEYIPKYNFEDKNIISTSLRIDCVVSAITNLSRNRILELISSGKVMLNYTRIREKNKIVKKYDIITVRGFGKYKFIGDYGVTNRGRLKVLIKKFV